jgi:hypothetical protein
MTFRQLDSALIHKGKLNENDIVPTLRIAYINNKLMKIYRLLDGLNDPWYHKQTLAVTPAADITFAADPADASVFSLNYSTTTLIFATARTDLKVGTVFSFAYFSNGSPDITNCIVGRVTAVTTSKIYIFELISSTGGANYPPSPERTDTVGLLTIFGSPSSLVISLSTLYVKDILRIWDNAYTGGKPRIFTEIKDPQIFSVLHRDPFFDKQVAWFQRGDNVELYVGPNATALATINIEYRGKPAICADFDTDAFIDLPPEENQVLMDEVYAEYLTHTNQPIPEEIQQRQAEFSKRYESAMADVQRKEALVHGKRGG